MKKFKSGILSLFFIAFLLLLHIVKIYGQYCVPFEVDEIELCLREEDAKQIEVKK